MSNISHADINTSCLGVKSKLSGLPVVITAEVPERPNRMSARKHSAVFGGYSYLHWCTVVSGSPIATASQ